MAEDATRITSPVRAFECHNCNVEAILVFPDGRHMVTGAEDKMLWLWELREGTVLQKIEKRRKRVRAMAVSRDRQLMVSGDDNGGFTAWDWDSERGTESLNQTAQIIEAHSMEIRSLDFSPDGAVLATGSWDKTVKLWNTKTWQLQGYPIKFHDRVYCVRYSPSGNILAVATRNDIYIFNSSTREPITIFKAHQPEPSGRSRRTVSYPKDEGATFLWTPDGARLLLAGCSFNNSIREWDTSTWKQVDNPWTGHTGRINAIAVNSAGTLVASASRDKSVRLWRLSDRRTIAIFKHSSVVHSVTFSTDGKRVFSGGNDKKISEWAVPEGALPKKHRDRTPTAPKVVSNLKILAINTTARNACITGDLPAAERLLTQEIDVDAGNSNTYTSRSFVMTRKRDWDCALNDALQSIKIQPSSTGYISKGMALCGKQRLQDAMKAFDLAFMFADEDPKIIHFLLLVKAVTLFNANELDEGMQRVQQLSVACPDADTLACHIVEAYFHVELGIRASNDERHSEALHHFTAAVKAIDYPSQLDIHAIYEDFVVLFGWDLKSLWQSANQKRCHALLCADRLEEAMESYHHMMNMSDETMKASCLDWSTDFKQQCGALYATNGDAALRASDYDKAIELCSVAINLGSVCDTAFANRSRARSEKMLWQEALLDALKVIELNTSSHIGYQLKHAALHGAQRYHEAIEAFQVMICILDNDPDVQIRKLRQLYLSPYEAEGAIRKVIHAQTEHTPLRLLDTTTGLICDREAQITAFKTSTEYQELLSSTMRHADLRMERIKKAVNIYFRCVTLSHRWEEKEPLLHDIQDKVVYKLNAVGGIAKLQSFCEVARRADYRWAWIDTCCINQHNNAELQQSLNSMFDWYRHSALTIVYLSDVLPPSKSGALARSAWNTRGWTVPEFLAPKVLLFYQKDWTRYLDDHSPNHKESITIMQELEEATGIDARSLVAFNPGMNGAREKLQWASTRITTLPEDIAYSLFGIFDIHLPVLYGEKKHNALGRLLQEIVAKSGDISALDWVGESSEFNSCLPADIASYEAPPFTPPSLSEDDIQTSVTSIRNAVPIDLASKLYTLFDTLCAPRFANCRLHMPCIAFPVTEIKRSSARDQPELYFTYAVKANGLCDLLITTGDKLPQFSRERPTRRTFMLVRPWDRHLMELPDFVDDDPGVEDWDLPGSRSPAGSDSHSAAGSDSYSRALRLIVRLGQPFGALLLAQQRGGEYKRIASDRDITGQVVDIASVHNMMDVRTLEIL